MSGRDDDPSEAAFYIAVGLVGTAALVLGALAGVAAVGYALGRGLALLVGVAG